MGKMSQSGRNGNGYMPREFSFAPVMFRTCSCHLGEFFLRWQRTASLLLAGFAAFAMPTKRSPMRIVVDDDDDSFSTSERWICVSMCRLFFCVRVRR